MEMDQEGQEDNIVTVEDLISEHQRICDVAREELKRKNSDYSHGEDALQNFRSYSSLNVCSMNEGIMSRMVDKMSRLSGLIQKGDRSVDDETFEDTIRDLINYAILLKCSRDEDKN